MPHSIYRTKLVVIGDSTVGKTALTQMFVTDGREFPKNYNMTLGVDVNLKQIPIAGTDDIVEFLIYDSTGLDLYRDYMTKYWVLPSLLMIVYDVTLQSSFESVPQWLEIALGSQWAHQNRPNLQVLVANKIDLVGRRFISEDIGQKLAEKYNFQYFETSSKDNQGVEDTFLWLAKEWHSFCKANTDNKSSGKFENSFSKSAFKTSMVF